MKINLGKKEIIHFIGIGGIGMSGLALIMKQLGFKIQGSDISVNKNIERLKKSNIKIFTRHKISNLNKANIIVMSSAIKNNNDELRYNWENQSASWNYDASITIPNNEWVMCAVSVTSSAATLYMFKLDGTISSGTNTTTHNSGTFPYDAAGEFTIGQDNNGDARYFDGDVSMGLVYSRALSQTELKQNFDATKHLSLIHI